MSMGRDDLGHRSETVRRVNLSTILRELHGSGPMSRSDLGTRTGLTRSAIRGLIGELAAGDLVIEGPAALDGTPGRPAPVVRPVAEGVGSAVAVVGIVRRSDGMVSMSPYLGWRDEPLGERLAEALGPDVAITFAIE